ncbi:hypothetical protein C8A00DRAFT_15853 [Chaetomidium leptoderma]|uniref:Uncharacterized protein n=1 Tax=Chaetomidium leptoderma TaxID=669021 RepID=A0AAN6VKB2_9PEZI|nr:hypothetical protein C8A00DRAFT_15853 [Chaetomidium leptoderma]
MEYFPGELYDAIVTALHGQFCRCSSAYERPTVWDSLQWNSEGCDDETPKRFQQELCKLRLVNKRFSAAANRFVLSHCIFAFDVSHRYSWGVMKKVEYCASKNNHGILSRITGLRIDLPRRITDDQITAAKSARDEFLRCLATLKAPLGSVTALEVRLDEWSQDYDTPCPDLGGKILTFVRNNLPNLTDLYMTCSTPTATAIIVHLPPEVRNKLRRLIFSCTMGYGRELDHVSQLPNLSELGLSGFSKAPITLHPENKGLTRLHLCSVMISASYLLAIITRSPACTTGANLFNNDSPLVELVLSFVNLDLPSGPYEGFTWGEVFSAIRKHCAALRSLSVGYLCYGATARQQHGWAKPFHADDHDGLRMLARHVRARPGGEVKGTVRDPTGSTLCPLCHAVVCEDV